MKLSDPKSTSTAARKMSRIGLIGVGLAVFAIGYFGVELTGKAARGTNAMRVDVCVTAEQLELKLVVGKMTMVMALSFATHADAVA
jgi:hypothetical protein